MTPHAPDQAAADRDPRHGERGHVLAGVMVVVAVMLILSTVAFQAWEDQIKRENEEEMMFRAGEIARGIYRYRREQGGEPLLTLDRLMEPGNDGQYFLRRRYADPLSKDGKWGALYDANGTIVDPTQTVGAGQGGAPGQGGGIGGIANQGGFGNRQGGLGGQGGGGGQGGIGGQGGGIGGQGGGLGGQGGAGNQGGIGGQNGQPGGATDFGELPKTVGFSDPDKLADLNASNIQAGGLPIAGVRTTSEDMPFRVWNDFEEYAEWQFTFRWVEQELQRLAMAGKAPLNNRQGGPGGAGGLGLNQGGTQGGIGNRGGGIGSSGLGGGGGGGRSGGRNGNR